MSVASTITKPVRAGLPGFEPINLAQAKKQVELPSEYVYHDDHLVELISFSREQVEHDTGIIAASSSWTLKMDQWPAGDWIELPIRPVASITSIQYADTAGTTQTFASTDYFLSSHEVTPRIVLAYSKYWPSTRGWREDITITLLAGYANADAVPRLFKHACLLELARRFKDRDAREYASSDMGGYGRAYEMLIRRLARATYP